MPAIEGRELHDAKTLCSGDHRGVDRPERQVSIVGYELGDPDPIGRPNWFRDQVSCRQVTEESNLSLGAKPGLEQVRHLSHDELRDDQRPRMAFREGQAGFVVSIVFVDVGVQRPGIDDQRDRVASRRRISSMRRAVCVRPLRPDFAAISRRRPPPRWDSMASRVTSETLVPRRAASWRSRASSSSGSFTVVRLMVCQHTLPPTAKSTPQSSRDKRPGRTGQGVAKLVPSPWMVADACLEPGDPLYVDVRIEAG